MMVIVEMKVPSLTYPIKILIFWGADPVMLSRPQIGQKPSWQLESMIQPAKPACSNKNNNNDNNSNNNNNNDNYYENNINNVLYRWAKSIAPYDQLWRQHASKLERIRTHAGPHRVKDLFKLKL